jgi:transcriptional regulator with XRE-family HTH domain
MENYSEKLARILAASGWSQETLSDKLGVSFVTLNKWVNNKTEPRDKAKERIDVLFAEILGTDTTEKTEVARVKKLAVGKKLSINKLLANRELLDQMTVHLTYHSNATEGSTMTEGDVEAVIFDHKVLRNRTAIEQREAINHQTALNFLLDELQDQGKNFTVTPEFVIIPFISLRWTAFTSSGVTVKFLP